MKREEILRTAVNERRASQRTASEQQASEEEARRGPARKTFRVFDAARLRAGTVLPAERRGTLTMRDLEQMHEEA